MGAPKTRKITDRSFVDDWPPLVAQLIHYWDERRGALRAPSADRTPAFLWSESGA